MTQWLTILTVSLALLALPALAQTKPTVDDEPKPAAFRIAAVANRPDAAPDTRTYLATDGDGDAQIRFLIELDGKRVKGVVEGGGEAPVDISFARGRFRHVAGAKPEAFLEKVAAALEAKAPKRSSAKAQVLPFDIAVFGTHDSRSPGFTNNPPGDWTTTKLFLADGNAEVFFNFNPVSGEAEFAIKDEDYGNLVVEELSKVFW